MHGWDSVAPPGNPAATEKTKGGLPIGKEPAYSPTTVYGMSPAIRREIEKEYKTNEAGNDIVGIFGSGAGLMNKQYIEKINDAYRIVGTRVSLDSIVYAFWRGQTAESIAQSFPVLTLEQVYGALTFYLANQADINAYLEKAEIEFESLRETARERDPMFYKKLADIQCSVA